MFTAATKINSFGVHINEKPKTQASADGQNINLAKYDMKYEERTIKDKEEIKERADFKLKELNLFPKDLKKLTVAFLKTAQEESLTRFMSSNLKIIPEEKVSKYFKRNGMESFHYRNICWHIPIAYSLKTEQRLGYMTRVKMLLMSRSCS